MKDHKWDYKLKLVFKWWTLTLGSGLSLLMCKASLILSVKADLAESIILKHEGE